MWDIKKFLTENKIILSEQETNPFALYSGFKNTNLATKRIAAAIKSVAPKLKSGKMSEEAAAKAVYREVRKWSKVGANDTESLEAITDVLGKAAGQEMEWRIDSY